MLTRLNKDCPVRAVFGRCLVLLGLLLLGDWGASARTFYITDPTDSTRPTSLRGAIVEALRRGDDNVIVLGQTGAHRKVRLEPWVFHLTIRGAITADDLGGALNIMGGKLTIMGADSNVVIDATGLGQRVFQVFPGAQLTLQNVTITGGAPTEGAPTDYGYSPILDGGGIYNAGTMVMNHCIIRGNSSGQVLIENEYFQNIHGGDGGGIFNSGTLTMNDCQVTSNSCAAGGTYGGNGGGINNAGTAVLNNCLINDNFAGAGLVGTDQNIDWIYIPGGVGGNGGSGGGLYNSGEMNVSDCTVAGNLSGSGGDGISGSWGGSGGAGGDGAGICNLGDLSINTCTFSGNICGNGGVGAPGWGISSGGSGGDGGCGGGLYNAGTFEMTSGTIALNQAGAGASGASTSLIYVYTSATPAATGGAGGSGGGMMNDATNTAAVVRNTLIAGNLANTNGLGGTNFVEESQEIIAGADGTPGYGPDMGGGFTSAGFNLVGAADGATGFTNHLRADLVGSVALPIDPLLGPLQMNGGPTPTHALLAGSPAINQGNCFGIHEDQRGWHRPFKYPGIAFSPGGDGSDIGAFELDTLLPPR